MIYDIRSNIHPIDSLLDWSKTHMMINPKWCKRFDKYMYEAKQIRLQLKNNKIELIYKCVYIKITKDCNAPLIVCLQKASQTETKDIKLEKRVI